MLRATGGVTNRANSVFTGVPPPVPGAVDPLIEVAEAFYAERRLPCTFHLTPATQPPALDAILAARGYTVLQPSEVWTAAIAEVLARTGAALRGLTVAGVADSAWFDCAYDEPPPRRRVHEQIVRRIGQPCGFAAARAEGVVVSCGLAVEDGGWVGVFSMATRPGHRRRGLARAVLHGLAAWGQERGAAAMYLQVLAANSGARELYARSGFTRRYGYRYRVRPLTG